MALVTTPSGWTVDGGNGVSLFGKYCTVLGGNGVSMLGNVWLVLGGIGVSMFGKVAKINNK